MIGVEARDLRPGDKIVGVGTVKWARRDPDGDIHVRLIDNAPHKPENVWFDYDAWLRIERRADA